MSRRIEVFILIVISIACGLAFWHVSEATIVPVVRYGSDGPNAVQVTGSGWLTLIMTGLGAGGFSMASVWTILRHAAELLPTSNPLHRWGGAAIDTAQLGVYLQAYQAAKSAEEKAAIRSAAKLADASLFDELFPSDGA